MQPKSITGAPTRGLARRLSGAGERTQRGRARELSGAGREDSAGPGSALVDERDRPLQHRLEHGPSQATSERVLLARMKGPDDPPIADPDLRAVPEAGPWPGHLATAGGHRAEGRLPAELSERDDHSHLV